MITTASVHALPELPNNQRDDQRPVLIVEDNPANLLLAASALQRGGFRIAKARSAEEALVQVHATLPQAVLVDVQLPGMDGLTLTRRLKADAATAAIPVIGLSAYAMPEDRERALAAGCIGYLTKPVDPVTLPGQLATLLAGALAPSSDVAGSIGPPEYPARASAQPLEATREATRATSTPPPTVAAAAVKSVAAVDVDPERGAVAASPAAASGGAHRILVVDDQPANVSLLHAQLTRAGYDVSGATGGRQALDAVLALRPDLVLLDVSMAGIDGFEVCRQLKAMPATQLIPVVLLTALHEPADKLAGLDAGADDFLTKPADVAELLARVRALLRTRALHDELTRSREEIARQAGELAARRHAEGEVLDINSRLRAALAQLESAQQQVVQQERLKALGEMASGIAHDLNNALSPVLGFSELLVGLLEQPSDPATVRRYLELIRTGADDAAKVVRRLREFYRATEGTDELQPIELQPLIEEAVSLTQPKWKDQAQAEGRTITVLSECSGGPTIAGDAHLLREALTNLIFNAVDAMPRGGTITVRTSPAEGPATRDRPGRAATQSDTQPGQVVVEVRDTGVGMDERTRRRCLEPFFTTKGEHGTGLGLAMVHGIVQRHAGTIDIASTPGQGTTFTLRFPAYNDPAPVVAESFPPTVDGTAPPLRVLLIDDDPRARTATKALLEADHHLVVAAGGGSEALTLYQTTPVDLVITDRAMPDMTGDQVAGTLRKRGFAGQVFLLTGFGDLMREAGERPPGIDAVISKPASLAALRQAIESSQRAQSPEHAQSLQRAAG